MAAGNSREADVAIVKNFLFSRKISVFVLKAFQLVR